MFFDQLCVYLQETYLENEKYIKSTSLSEEGKMLKAPSLSLWSFPCILLCLQSQQTALTSQQGLWLDTTYTVFTVTLEWMT